MKFTTTVTIETATLEQAGIVLNERLAHEDDYGFDYSLDFDPPSIVPEESERDALAREARQEALLDAGPILAEYRRQKGEL